MSTAVTNDDRDPLCVFVEPLGEDYWIGHGAKLHFAAEGAGEINVIRHPQGLSLWFSDADPYGVTVRDDAGVEVSCGFGRPDGWPADD